MYQERRFIMDKAKVQRAFDAKVAALEEENVRALEEGRDAATRRLIADNKRLKDELRWAYLQGSGSTAVVVLRPPVPLLSHFFLADACTLANHIPTSNTERWHLVFMFFLLRFQQEVTDELKSESGRVADTNKKLLRELSLFEDKEQEYARQVRLLAL